MKAQHLALGAALLGAAALYASGPAPAGDSAVAEAAPRRAPRAVQVNTPVATPATASAGKAGPATLVALLPREQLYDAPGQRGDALFGSRDFTPPAPVVRPAPAAPPSAPAPPFAVIGKLLTDGHWEVYLARGEATYTARAGLLIDPNYRVETIAPPVLTLTYLPLKQTQHLDIGSD